MTILCATDFSPSSEHATKLAAALAHEHGDSVSLLHVIQPFPQVSAYASDGGAAWELGVKASADTMLAATVEELRRDGLRAEAHVAFGAPASTLLAAIDDQKPRLVVMGTHGRKGLARMFVGSVARSVVKAASCPVLVTRGGDGSPQRWSGKEALRLAVGVDGSRASAGALAWLAALPSSRPLETTIVRLYWPAQEAVVYGLDVEPTGEDPVPTLLPLMERDLRRQLQGTRLLGSVERFCPAHVNASEVLVEQARQIGADALVVGVPKGRIEAWDDLTVTDVLATATCPVFCIPLAAAPPARRTWHYHSVLVATDLSELATPTLRAAYGLLPAGGRVELCHVHESERQPLLASSPRSVPPLAGEERLAITSKLQALIPPDAREQGITTNISVIDGTSAVTGILQAAARLEVDVLTLGSHGRSGWKRAVLGSVAEEVCRRADRPVLIVHGQSSE
jgi:nucleotide-binding universal stress UspA family protein